MIWICLLFGILIGMIIGSILMYYKNYNLLHNQKFLYNELQNNKIKLNTYQKELNYHFKHSIESLNKIANDYQILYKNITKSANLFLPNEYIQENMDSFLEKTNKDKNDKKLTLKKAPIDYCEDINNNVKKK